MFSYLALIVAAEPAGPWGSPLNCTAGYFARTVGHALPGHLAASAAWYATPPYHLQMVNPPSKLAAALLGQQFIFSKGPAWVRAYGEGRSYSLDDLLAGIKVN
jgi:hypothetical protein